MPTVSAMAARISVDIPSLRSLAAQLADLAHLLNTDNDDETCIGAWVSDSKIRTALKNIQHDWSHKRGEFIAYLSGVSQGAQAAAEAYEQTEQHLARAAQH
jgi:Excreted virulence factor EspC, type VII ESX diderm